ncbi:capsule biosynthesis protein CapA [Roseibacterium sp. SDUM158016]|uniref:capsule biosynthesis protein n=1 Tax=Roseicyclus sediminis TaxID=2980997 RepID=UPI0021D0D243|nr:capsule biosynthesis protein CapA [Roseibacterium sp. SDUM158016]MCU4653157.1 capsule biosynthesis protein CapA [Roseibacterium sp. SDUM158016]
MTAQGHDGRTFLFLQGPHGPFFWQLSRQLRAAGARTLRIGFNRGDEVFWPERASYIARHAPLDSWAQDIAAILDETAVTDLVLYGDTRPIHADAIAAAKARGIIVHVFEEGYLRPYWVTYERGGANGHSRIMGRSVQDMRRALEGRDTDLPDAPARWGEMRHHVFYGALYHWFVLVANRRYAAVRPHRALTVRQEFRLYLRRLALMPLHWLDRILATRAIKTGGFPYHLALLQLEHDASFRDHGPFASQADFVATVIAGFTEGAPTHHHLVFKAHPLEDGRVPVRKDIRRIAEAHGVGHRVHFVRGGKLAGLLDEARSAVTVNSTAAQQALWRGLPLKCFGKAVYLKPEFVSDQPIAAFFRDPLRPDSRAYRDFRQYLLETSQVTGSFYSARGRRQLLRLVIDLMLSPEDAYDALDSGRPAPRQHLLAVK